MLLVMLCSDMTPEIKDVLELVVCTAGAGVSKCFVSVLRKWRRSSQTVGITSLQTSQGMAATEK